MPSGRPISGPASGKHGAASARGSTGRAPGEEPGRRGPAPPRPGASLRVGPGPSGSLCPPTRHPALGRAVGAGSAKPKLAHGTGGCQWAESCFQGTAE